MVGAAGSRNLSGGKDVHESVQFRGRPLSAGREFVLKGIWITKKEKEPRV